MADRHEPFAELFYLAVQLRVNAGYQVNDGSRCTRYGDGPEIVIAASSELESRRASPPGATP